MTIVIDTEIIDLFRIQWWQLQSKFGIKVFYLYIQRGLFPKDLQRFFDLQIMYSNLRLDRLFQNSVYRRLSDMFLSYFKCL